MSAQFLHMESYARTAGKGKEAGHTIWSIAAEADRRPEACKHVDAPQPPRALVGVSMHDAASQAKAWAEQSRDASNRKIRADGLCMGVGVVSMAPSTPAQDWEAFRDHAVEWLRLEFGERLRVVLEHADEKAPHLHFAVVPLPGERFSAIHRGKLAAEVAAAGGAVKGAQNAAYKAGMIAWQDRFHAQVASSHGMTRVGPRGRRLSRRDWLTAQNEAETQARLARSLKKAQQTLANDKARAQQDEARAQQAVQKDLGRLNLERSMIVQANLSLNAERVALGEDRKALAAERIVLDRHRKALDAERVLVDQQRRSNAGERALIRQEQQALHANRAQVERALQAVVNDPHGRLAIEVCELRDQLDQANELAAQATNQRDELARQMGQVRNENATLRAQLPVKRSVEATKSNRLSG